MDEQGMLALIDELSAYIEDAKPPFAKNNLKQIDPNICFEILDEMRASYPQEIAQARQIIRERQALLDEAEAQASRLIEDARSQAITIASEQEIVRISQSQAESIMAEAREMERQTRAGAEDYADEVFNHLEQSLDTALNSIKRCRDRLSANSINMGR
ncbi:MAG: ATPase [Anaerotardibacter sp.]